MIAVAVQSEVDTRIATAPEASCRLRWFRNDMPEVGGALRWSLPVSLLEKHHLGPSGLILIQQGIALAEGEEAEAREGRGSGGRTH